MAKRAKRNGVNKSAAVREYLSTNGEAKPKEAAAAISKQLGIAITPAFVSQVKTMDKKKSGKKSGKRGRRAAAVVSTVSNGSVSSVAAAIKAGRELLAAAGSTSEALAVIKALAG